MQRRAKKNRTQAHEKDKCVAVHFPGTLMRMTGGGERLNAR